MVNINYNYNLRKDQKMNKSVFATLLLLTASSAIAQNTDTTIVLNKEQIKEYQEFLKYKEEASHDLVPDFGEEWMITDRPHVAETPHLVPKGYFQWETGFQFQQSKTSDTRIKDVTYNTTLVRLGISRRFEGRVELEYLGTQSKRRTVDSLLQNVKGLSGINLASKIFICQQKGIIPEASLLYGIFLPYPGSPNFRPSYTGSEIKFLLVNRLFRWYEFEYNLGVQWDGITKNAAYAYAFNNEFEISQKLFFFLELYGFLYENSTSDDRFAGNFTPDNRANGGVWYRLTADWQVDLSGGFGLSKTSPDYYFAVGLSNRFRFRKKG